MKLAVLGGSIVLLLVLIGRFRLTAFLALLITSFAAGIAAGLSPDATVKSITKGIGDTMGSLTLILVFGAVLGKIIEESGAAHTICGALTRLFGERRLELSVLITGFLVGLPMIYNASFLVLIPLVYTLATTTGRPLMALGIPLSAALSVTHGYLPPHPAPTSIAVLYKADVHRTLFYGLLLALPAVVVAGPVLARFFMHMKNAPPATLHARRQFRKEELPGTSVSVLSVLAPVLLILAGADPTVALFVAAMLALVLLGWARGRATEDLMKSTGTAVSSIAMILLIIASGGAFKQVLIDSGTGEAIKQVASSLPVSPLILAWTAAAFFRAALGSATVAAITAAGVVLPVVSNSGASAELLVLATTAGSLMFSHFNDIGFWMFREYYNVSIRQTFQIWTVMESIVAIVGLLGTLLLSTVVHGEPAGVTRVAYVNSYHRGYPSSDEASAAMKARLTDAGVSVDEFLLDAKRNPEQVPLRASEIHAAIEKAHPALLIVSDDDAVKHVVLPWYRTGGMPVVFCGVNNDASPYALPADHITGILEIVPIEQTLRLVRERRPGAKRLLVLSEDSVSERSNTKLLDGKYRSLGYAPEYLLVKTFDEWKRGYAAAVKMAEVVYLPTNGAIQGWDAKDAAEWVAEHPGPLPVTGDDFMMPYAAFGLTKVAAEQGEWAAETALRILHGTPITQIPVAANQKTRCFVSRRLAGMAKWDAPAALACSDYNPMLR